MISGDILASIREARDEINELRAERDKLQKQNRLLQSVSLVLLLLLFWSAVGIAVLWVRWS